MRESPANRSAVSTETDWRYFLAGPLFPQTMFSRKSKCVREQKKYCVQFFRYGQHYVRRADICLLCERILCAETKFLCSLAPRGVCAHMRTGKREHYPNPRLRFNVNPRRSSLVHIVLAPVRESPRHPDLKVFH